MAQQHSSQTKKDSSTKQDSPKEGSSKLLQRFVNISDLQSSKQLESQQGVINGGPRVAQFQKQQTAVHHSPVFPTENLSEGLNSDPAQLQSYGLRIPASFDSNPVQLKPHGTTSEKNSAPHSSADFSPMDHLGFEGISHSVMSNESYDSWQGTAQCKAAPHGAFQCGDKTVVTQFRDPSAVLQANMVGDFIKKHRGKLHGAAVIGEGLLAVAASVAALVVTHGASALPSILGLAFGFVKIIRGIIMIAGDSEQDEEQKADLKKITDILRTLEGIAALSIGAVIGHPGPLLFGIAKTLRSLLTAYAHFTGVDDKSTKGKVIRAINAGLHAVEVVGLAISGGAALKAGHTAVGVLGLVGTGSKAVRTADNIHSVSSDIKEGQPQAGDQPPNEHSSLLEHSV